MGSGWVLDFSNSSFADFFQQLSIDIDNPKYTKRKSSGSKANRLRGFWEVEGDALVARAIAELIDYAEDDLRDQTTGSLKKPDQLLIRQCRDIVERLGGKPSQASQTSEEQFLAEDFSKVNLTMLALEGTILPILEQRLTEARACMTAGANLAAIFMAGSILEGLLLNEAQNAPQRFNQAAASPKDKSGNVRPFGEWSLAQFIDVASELKLLGEDIKKFSHALRDFRNYIHPYEQMTTGFAPNAGTAKISMQVLLAAINYLTKSRRDG